MKTKSFRFYNNLMGWVSFSIALLVYILTLEPTVSLWDCGEFIATAFKLQVGHPPGAPLFMMMGRVASLFAPSTEYVALAINTLSALASAFTILFLFWTISHLARRATCGESEPSRENTIAILGAATVGALAYTFTDSFWFSAVEAEVYALSAFFTAVVVWAMLKWEEQANEPHAARWLILIAYLMGLSVGVHLLNLLTIPALTLVFYYRRYPFSWRGLIKALLLSGVILITVLYGIIPGLPKVAGWFELLFVNGLGLPVQSGAITFFILFIAALAWVVWYSQRRKKPVLNTVALCIFAIVLGYSSYASLIIRSAANPPIDENSPSNVFALQSYLNREQYGDRPLFYGPYYSAPVTAQEDTYSWIERNGKYEKVASGVDLTYDSRFETIFPRMYSWQSPHIQEYKAWSGEPKSTLPAAGTDGKTENVPLPSFGQNLSFFFSYQSWHMYWRYFFWNFVGRLDDHHNPTGELLHGNTISGIKAIDAIALGNRSQLTDDMKAQPAYNRFFFLPFLLGVIGLFFHAKRDSKGAFVVAMLFVLTGIAIVVYLNQTPLQPRERDYSYAGSFYAFAIWIGFAVLWLTQLLQRHMKPTVAAAIASTSLLFVPALMAQQGWDDHDRSGRYHTRSYAYNYLNSCAPNAILFTAGDNDTFPLWYLQEVEGIRRDVRVCNLSLLGIDWYIDLMKRQTYESAPLPIAMESDKYTQGSRDIVYIIDQLQQTFPLKEVMEFVASDEHRLSSPGQPPISYIPSRHVMLPTDKETLLRTETIRPADTASLDRNITFSIPGKRIGKSTMIILDIIAHNNWERPIYFTSLDGDANIGLSNYMQLDGFAYRLVPIRTQTANRMEPGRILTDTLYKRLMVQFDWRNMGNPDQFVSYDIKRNVMVAGTRNAFVRLAKQLLQENDTARCVEVVEKSLQLMPHPDYAYDYSTLYQIDLLYSANASRQADSLLTNFLEYEEQYQRYFLSLGERRIGLLSYDISRHLAMINALSELGEQSPDEAIKARCQTLRSFYNEKQ